MSDAIQTVLTAVGGVLGTLLTVWGGIKVARLASKAQLKTAEIEETKVRASAYNDAQDAYRELTTDLREEISGLRKAIVEDREIHRQQIADLRLERSQNDAALNKRIDEMEERDDLSRRRIQALGAYIRQLVGVLRDHDISPPPAPPGITFD